MQLIKVIIIQNYHPRSQYQSNMNSGSNNSLYYIQNGHYNASSVKRKGKHQNIRQIMKRPESKATSPFSRNLQRCSDNKSYKETPRTNHSFLQTKKAEPKVEEVQSHFQQIQELITKQNNNLRQQNKMLMGQIKRMALRQKKYKDLYYQSLEQIKMTIQERNIYLNQIQELKIISETRMKSLENKLYNVSVEVNLEKSFQTTIENNLEGNQSQAELFSNFTIDKYD